MSGAIAAARNRSRSSVCASQALTASREPATTALRLAVLGTYQGRNTPTPSRIPPRAAISSLREILLGCTAGTLPGGGRDACRESSGAVAVACSVLARERRPPPRPRRPPPLLVGRLGARVRRLPRRGVGPPGAGRPRAVREAVPRGVPVGVVLADDPAQARGVPRGVRELRAGGGGGVRGRGGRAADGRRGDRAQPGEDRSGDRQRARGRDARRAAHGAAVV